jgi:hypothetical protein
VEFIADRCLAQLERMEKPARERGEREAKRRDEALAAAGVDPESEEADDKAQQELRRQERAREPRSRSRRAAPISTSASSSPSAPTSRC